jgi:hypothetical protein
VLQFGYGLRRSSSRKLELPCGSALAIGQINWQVFAAWTSGDASRDWIMVEREGSGVWFVNVCTLLEHFFGCLLVPTKQKT